jgi:flagellar biosynthesis/type III secretory pathway M-ring protein FliF/YscJ
METKSTGAAEGTLNGSDNKKRYWDMYLSISTYIASMVVQFLVLRFFIRLLREHYADKRKAALLNEKRAQKAREKRKEKHRKKQAKKRGATAKGMGGAEGVYHARFTTQGQA